MYLYNKNILKYVEIVGSEPKSMILNTEGRSNNYQRIDMCTSIPHPRADIIKAKF